MINHRRIKQQLPDYVGGNLGAEEQRNLEAHLALCNRCSSELKVLEDSLKSLREASDDPSSQRTPEFWHAFGWNVEWKIRNSEHQGVRAPIPLLDDVRAFLTLRRPYALGAGAAAVVLLTLLALWALRTPGQPDLRPRQVVAGRDVEPDSSAKRMSEYLRKSRTLLVGLSNTEPSNRTTDELRVEKELSRQLVSESRYLKRQPIDPRSARLIDDLDKVLIKLANTDQGKGEPDIELITNGIHRENLLFKLRMAEVAYAEPLVTTAKNSF